MSMGDQVGILNEGRIVQVGSPHEIYNSPRDTFVAAFVGSPPINLVPGDLADGRVSAFGGKLQTGLDRPWAKTTRPVTFGIRAEDVRVGPDEAVAARVHDVENHGVEKIVTLRIGDDLLRATVPATLAVAIYGDVRFGWNPDRLHCFDLASGVSLAHGG
jgi:multiple sugar transport system ATP-binding protein